MQIVVIGLFGTLSSYFTFANGGDGIFNAILGAPNSWSSVDGHDGFFFCSIFGEPSSYLTFANSGHGHFLGVIFG
jgi:hypothetical protein